MIWGGCLLYLHVLRLGQTYLKLWEEQQDENDIYIAACILTSLYVILISNLKDSSSLQHFLWISYTAELLGNKTAAAPLG